MKALSLCLLYVALTAAIVPLAAETRHPAEVAGIKSDNSDVKARITFSNQSDKTIKVYWLNYEGERVLYLTLMPGDEVEQLTFLTHPWLITDEDDNALQLYFPDAQARQVEIKNPGEP